MSELNERVLESFRAELRKIAAPNFHAMLGSAGALGGVGAVGGALLGGGLRGVQNYRRAREDGATVGQAALSGATGAIGGAGKGALIGGAAGLAGGAALGAARPELANKVRAAVDGLPGAHYGQRQVHTITGWTPEKGLASIGHGAAPRKAAVEEAAKQWEAAAMGRGKQTWGDKVLGRSPLRGAQKRLLNASEAYNAGRKAEEMGLTSIPGYLKSIRDNGAGKTMRAAVADQWHGVSPVNKALLVGVPAMELAGALRGPSVDEQGETRGQRVGRAAANTAAGMLLSPFTMTAQMALGPGIASAGRRVGGLFSQKPTPPGAPDLTQDSGQATPVERETTERAAGGAGLETMSS